MRFEDYAREASRALSASGRGVDVPPVAEMRARRRRRGLVLGSTAVVVLAAGMVAIVAALGSLAGDGEAANGSASQVSVPAATVPGEGGGVLFGPPRIEEADTVEFPITLLDGTRLTLTLPRSLADDVHGLVPAGAASWRLDPCCARSLDVIYGSVDDLYGERQPDVEYEDADGNPVGFYTEEGDLDYLVFQYGSWVVRAWDGDPEGQRFSEENREMFASLMRGHETAEGFLVLDPAEPMDIGPTDSPNATLTTLTGEGTVGVFKSRDCASERPSDNPGLVTSDGHLVSFAESSGMTSICFPDSSLFLWVSRLDLSEAELEAIDLTYSTGQPDEETSRSTTSTSVTTNPEADGFGTWTRVSGADFGGIGDQVVSGLASSPVGFVAVGEDERSESSEDDEAAVWTSATGEGWTRVESHTSFVDSAMNDVVWFPQEGLYVAVGHHVSDGAVWISTKGDTWERIALLEHSNEGGGIEVDAITSIPEGLVAVGREWLSEGSSIPAVWRSTDGRQWGRTGDLTQFGDRAAMADVTQHGSVAFAVGHIDDNTPAVWMSSDLNQWQLVPIAPQIADTVELTSIASDQTQLVVTGTSDAVDPRAWTSTDGQTWRPKQQTNLTVGIPTLEHATSTPHGWLAVGSDGSTYRPRIGAAVWHSPSGDVWHRYPTDAASLSPDPAAVAMTTSAFGEDIGIAAGVTGQECVERFAQCDLDAAFWVWEP